MVRLKHKAPRFGLEQIKSNSISQVAFHSYSREGSEIIIKKIYSVQKLRMSTSEK